jgi:hypothetical protein
MFTRYTAIVLIPLTVLSVKVYAQDQTPPPSAPATMQPSQTQPPPANAPQGMQPGQPTPPDQLTPEQQQIQQMRDIFQTMIQRMIAKGINPGDFFQQMQNGADPGEIQKQLVDQGLIDQATLNQLQTTMQSVTFNRVKLQLDATDDEWKVLGPLIQKVTAALAAINGTRNGMGMAAFFSTASAAGADLAKARRAVRDALNNPATHADSFAILLREFREARDRAQAELDSDRQDLTNVVTVRQEAVLASLGILE